MSHSYDTSTYVAEASQVPARLESPEQLRGLSHRRIPGAGEVT